MPQRSQDFVEIDSTSGHLVCKFPPNTRLHGGAHGAFRIPIRKARKVVFRDEPSDVLRAIVEALDKKAESIKQVTGDHQHIKVHFVPDAAIDDVLRHVVLACTNNGLRPRYTGPQMLTATPTYAV